MGPISDGEASVLAGTSPPELTMDAGTSSLKRIMDSHGYQAYWGEFLSDRMYEVPDWARTEPERGWYHDARASWNILHAALSHVRHVWGQLPPPMQKDVVSRLRFLADWLEQLGGSNWSPRDYDSPETEFVPTDAGLKPRTICRESK